MRIEACEENARENATTKNVVESILLGGDEVIGSERQLIVLLLSRLFFFSLFSPWFSRTGGGPGTISKLETGASVSAGVNPHVPPHTLRTSCLAPPSRPENADEVRYNSCDFTWWSMS